MDAQRIRWSPPVKITVSILLLIFIIYLLFRFSVVIPPFILALILAYILTPLVARLEDQLEISRGFASLIAYLILIIVALMLPLLLLPPLASQLAVLNVDIQLLLEQAERADRAPVQCTGVDVGRFATRPAADDLAAGPG